MRGLSRFLACLLVAAVLATVGGALFDVVHGGTTITRSIAYAFWIAAAVALVLMAGAGNKRLARRFDLPFIEGWLFLAAACALTGVGIAVDVAGG
jgi:hypothetical protein